MFSICGKIVFSGIVLSLLVMYLYGVVCVVSLIAATAVRFRVVMVVIVVIVFALSS
jgi:hypothetical protein